MAARCDEMEFSLYGGEGGELVEGVENFNYQGQPLVQTDDDCPLVWQNIMHTRLVWGRLGKLIRWEGVDPKV